MSLDEESGFAVPIRRSGIQPLLVMGAPRKFTILNAFFAVFLVLNLWAWEFLWVPLLLQAIAAYICQKVDPEFFEILWRFYKTQKKLDYYEG